MLKNYFLMSFYIMLSVSLFAQSKEIISDIDGNEYDVITIGTQQWMAENLRVEHYRNGDPIAGNLNENQWKFTTEGAFAFYEDNYNYVEHYGLLYNWYAVADERRLCPEGWTVPDESHWEQLTETIDPEAWGNRNILGTTLKDQHQVNTPIGGGYDADEHPRWDEHYRRYGTNDYDFSALPAGTYTVNANYANLGKYAYFWSADEASEDYAPARIMLYSHAGTSTGNYPKNAGLSVRCIKEDNGEDDPLEYELTISVVGEGTTNPSAGTHTYNEGTEVDLTATPDDGWEFEKWVIDGVDVMGSSTQATMDKDITAVAHFEEEDDEGLPTVNLNGTIIYVNTEDYEITVQWGGFLTTTNATSETDGKQNTEDIIDVLGEFGGILYAAKACDELDAHGYTDWYLPAKDELILLFENQDDIGGFDTDSPWYWSSTEDSSTNAIRVRFDSGLSNASGKNQSFNVRCVRRNL